MLPNICHVCFFLKDWPVWRWSTIFSPQDTGGSLYPSTGMNPNMLIYQCCSQALTTGHFFLSILHVLFSPSSYLPSPPHSLSHQLPSSLSTYLLLPTFLPPIKSPLSSFPQGSTLAVVRSSETTIKCYGRVSKITNSSGRWISFKEQTFLISTSHLVIPYCREQKINIL